MVLVTPKHEQGLLYWDRSSQSLGRVGTRIGVLFLAARLLLILMVTVVPVLSITEEVLTVLASR